MALLETNNLNIIGNIIADGVNKYPNKKALTIENNGEEETRTFQELWDNAQRVSLHLRDIGCAKGDRVGVLLQNHPEFVELLIATSLLGIVLVPLDPRTKGEKLRYMLSNSECKGLFAAAYNIDNIVDIASELDFIKWLGVVGEDNHIGNVLPFEVFSFKNIYKSKTEYSPLPVLIEDENETMQIMYTSGTTGDPKGILIHHGRFGGAGDHGKAVFGYTGTDCLYTGLSLTHGNAQFVTLAPALKMGIPAVISQKFTKSRFWEIIQKHKCTSFSLLGGMATAIYSEDINDLEKNNSVRLVVSAGMPASIWQDFEKRFAVDIIEFYGAMEGGMTFKPVGQGPVGSCGRVAPGLEAKIFSDDNEVLPPNQPGEIRFRFADGSPIKVSYYKNPEASLKKVHDGWLCSGDVVTMDEDGWVFYMFRKGGGIRRNGDFVNVGLVEKSLAEHPNVSDVFVYGIQAKSGAPGEKDIIASVVLVNDSPNSAKEIYSWCSSKVDKTLIPELFFSKSLMSSL
jgi:crotonobetaine/carnitine-CoA ligase